VILGFKQSPPMKGLAELNSDGSCYDNLGRAGFGPTIRGEAGEWHVTLWVILVYK